MAQINYELQPRSYELIRDRLGLIIADELQLQASVSYEDLFLAPVYVQRSKPVQTEETPVVCVSVDKGAYDNHTVLDSDGEFTFFVDCYATGSYSSLNRGDVLASKDAQKLAGVVEAIIANPIYKTLGFTPPFIMRSKVTGFEPAIIERGEESNMSVVRVTVVVKAGQSEIASDPIDSFTTQTQVLIYNTDEGYLYSGTGAPVPPSPSCAPAYVVNSNGEFFQEISSGGGFELPDTPVTVKDQNGNTLATESVPSVSGGEIVVDPAQQAVTYAIKDTLNNILYSGSVNAPGNLDQTIQDSTAVLKDTSGTVLSTTSILAEGSEDITAPDATLHIKKENDGTIANVTLKSGENDTFTVDNNEISVNGNLEFEIHATDNLDIRLRDESNNVVTPISVTHSGGHATIVFPDPVACEPVDLFVGEANVGSFPSGSDIFVKVIQDGLEVIPEDITVVDDEVSIILEDTTPCPPVPIGATLMKTGQTISYASGDDGDIEAGREVSFTTLNVNNPFGNSNRFTDILGGQTYTLPIVIDWSTYNGFTVLGYRRTLSLSYTNWTTANTSAQAVSIGTYTTGWRLPNRKEMENIMNMGVTGTIFNYAPFSITVDRNVWTGTTNPIVTANAFLLASTGNGGMSSVGKTIVAGDFIPCRIFTVTGTTLT